MNSVRSKSLAFIVLILRNPKQRASYSMQFLIFVEPKCGSKLFVCKNIRSRIGKHSTSPKKTWTLFVVYTNQHNVIDPYVNHIFTYIIWKNIYLSTAPNTHNELNLSNVQTIECQQNIYLQHSERKEQKAKRRYAYLKPALE